MLDKTKESISVEIDFTECPYNTQDSINHWVDYQLKQAGIPIQGVLTLKGLVKGSIIRLPNPVLPTLVTYTWSPDPGS